jgi:hypothetical protein
MKILNLILACNTSPWIDVEQSILDTFYKQKEDTQVYFYHGNSTHSYHDETHIYLKSPEGFQNIGRKTIEAFEYALMNFDFDVIYRSNNSSYVDYKLLKAKLETLPVTGLYAGVVGKCYSGNFASGCGFVLSKDLVLDLVLNADNLNHSVMDDVMISEHLRDKVVITPMDRFDVDETMTIIDPNYHHYRCKPVYSSYKEFVPLTFKKIYGLKYGN